MDDFRFMLTKLTMCSTMDSLKNDESLPMILLCAGSAMVKLAQDEFIAREEAKRTPEEVVEAQQKADEAINGLEALVKEAREKRKEYEKSKDGV